jgi:hypothetical protein
VSIGCFIEILRQVVDLQRGFGNALSEEPGPYHTKSEGDRQLPGGNRSVFTFERVRNLRLHEPPSVGISPTRSNLEHHSKFSSELRTSGCNKKLWTNYCICKVTVRMHRLLTCELRVTAVQQLTVIVIDGPWVLSGAPSVVWLGWGSFLFYLWDVRMCKGGRNLEYFIQRQLSSGKRAGKTTGRYKKRCTNENNRYRETHLTTTKCLLYVSGKHPPRATMHVFGPQLTNVPHQPLLGPAMMSTSFSR